MECIAQRNLPVSDGMDGSMPGLGLQFIKKICISLMNGFSVLISEVVLCTFYDCMLLGVIETSLIQAGYPKLIYLGTTIIFPPLMYDIGACV